jgi:hypothetical protein
VKRPPVRWPRWIAWGLLALAAAGPSAWLGARLLAGDRRSARFLTYHQVLPQSSNVVLQASSSDGLGFEVDPRPLAWEADTHSGALVDGEPGALFFLDAPSDALVRLDLGTGEVEPLVIEGDCSGERACMDPSWVPGPGRHGRLFYLSAPSLADPANPAQVNEVRSARSEDGVHWTPEPGARLTAPGLVDPDVLALAGGGYRLYFTLVHEGEGPDGATAIHSAFSADGTSFQEEPGVRAWHACASSTVQLDDGGFRLYFQGEDEGILSARSEDGLAFELEPGLRVPFEPVSGARIMGPSAPAVLRHPDGGWWMTLNAIHEPAFPGNELLAYASCTEDCVRRELPGEDAVLWGCLLTCAPDTSQHGPPRRQPTFPR